MEPIDRRVTAAGLLALRDEPDAAGAIGRALQVAAMPTDLARRTSEEIQQFLASGDATLAAQLVHSAIVRRSGRPA